jgi:hypothetical protein
LVFVLARLCMPWFTQDDREREGAMKNHDEAAYARREARAIVGGCAAYLHFWRQRCNGHRLRLGSVQRSLIKICQCTAMYCDCIDAMQIIHFSETDMDERERGLCAPTRLSPQAFDNHMQQLGRSVCVACADGGRLDERERVFAQCRHTPMCPSLSDISAYFSHMARKYAGFIGIIIQKFTGIIPALIRKCAGIN